MLPTAHVISIYLDDYVAIVSNRRDFKFAVVCLLVRVVLNSVIVNI